jgi:ferredoxin
VSGAGQNAVRVMVDPERCMGSGTCIAVAPALFEMGDDGTATPLRSLSEPSTKLDQAVSRCPTGAIGTTQPE